VNNRINSTPQITTIMTFELTILSRFLNQLKEMKQSEVNIKLDRINTYLIDFWLTVKLLQSNFVL